MEDDKVKSYGLTFLLYGPRRAVVSYQFLNRKKWLGPVAGLVK
jgi:hypothetical protein